MKVFVIKESSTAGGKQLLIAYVDKKAADFKAKTLEKEWFVYTVHEFEGEPISGNRIIIDSVVHDLCIMRGELFLGQQVYNRLSDEELSALLMYLKTL